MFHIESGGGGGGCLRTKASRHARAQCHVSVLFYARADIDTSYAHSLKFFFAGILVAWRTKVVALQSQ